MNQRTWNKSLIAASVIAVTISLASLWLEWSASGNLNWRISILALALVLGTAFLSYSLRVVRFYLILSRSGVPISLGRTALAQAVGFALSVTPGSVGELFKLRLIEERVGTPLKDTAPMLLLDRILEMGGFVVLLLASAAALPALRDRLPDLLLLSAGVLLLAALALFVRRTGLFCLLSQPLNRFALGRRLLPWLRQMWRQLRANLTPQQLVPGLALTALARISDGLVLFFAAQMLGVPLALPLAVSVIAVGGFAGSVTLLPGGAGAVETTMAGLLMLSGAPFSSALAITLLARLSTLWLWVAVGLGLVLILQLTPKRALTQHI